MHKGFRVAKKISIHAPARGATNVSATVGTIEADFNPRSREGSDNCQLLLRALLASISIHAPARGATGIPDGIPTTAGISIHAPARRATFNGAGICRYTTISIHAPARGATTLCLTACRFHPDFNPRSREGSDPYPPRNSHGSYPYFNPRSREGSDSAS